MLAGCGFHHGSLGPVEDAQLGDSARDVAGDVAIDAPPPAFCPSDPHLRLCFSFDQATLPSSLPNEGAANVSAQLTNVTRIAKGTGGAAQLGATSEIYIPYSTEVANIQTIEILYRYDSEPTTDGGRMGLMDSNVATPNNISLFFYRADPTHQLRCGLGSEVSVWSATLTTNTWYHLICDCEATTNQRMYVDGVMIGDTAGACAAGGAFSTPDGFTIGSNNNGGPTGIDSQLLGAIDGIRLWDIPRPPLPPAN